MMMMITLVYCYLLLLLPSVGAFSGFLPHTRTKHQSRVKLWASTPATPPPLKQVDAVAPAAAAAAAAKKKPDKLTKEAEELLAAMEARDKHEKYNLILAQVAPAVRIAFPEEFGFEPGDFTPGQLVAALKELGFDLVLDTNTAADLTILEEGTELLHRLKAGNRPDNFGAPGADPGREPLPLFTSCCPGWMNFIEKSEPELAPYISSCKSPHMMYGALIKEYSKQILSESPEKVYLTSVMPCVRKRGESDRPAFTHSLEGGATNSNDVVVREVDNVITTKDLGMLLRMKNIDPSKLEPQTFDSPFQRDGKDGTGSGAGQLFGATGGVMEAAVRTVYELVTGQTLPRLEFDEVRGLDGVKEAVILLCSEDMTGEDGCLDYLRVAVCSGLGNAKQLLKKIKSGEANYDFVEVMACPGGCINGGGQPTGKPEMVAKRLETLYEFDRKLPIRKSHENPTVQRIYSDLVGEAGGETAHRLFHVKPVYGGGGGEEEDEIRP